MSGSRSAIIVSLRVAPGLAKEFVAIGEFLRSEGWSVRYLLAEGYEKWMPDGFDFASASILPMPASRVASLRLWRDLPRQLAGRLGPSPVDYVCVYNPHPLNARVLQFFRRRDRRTRRSLVLHEPWVPVRERPRYGWRGVLKLLAVDFFSTTSLFACTDVILPSEHALSLYRARKLPTPSIDEHLIPLVVPAGRPRLAPSKEPYVCFVGTVNPARRVDDVFEVARGIQERGLPVRVKILTKSPVTSDEPGVDVISMHSISDADISALVRGSLALFLPHTAASQSGNVPVAFREGTPIISYGVPGLTQHVHHGETGYVVRRDALREDAARACSYLLENDLRQNCLDYFTSYFSVETLPSRYRWLDVPANEGS